jgi:hypothetical protein
MADDGVVWKGGLLDDDDDGKKPVRCGVGRGEWWAHSGVVNCPVVVKMEGTVGIWLCPTERVGAKFLPETADRFTLHSPLLVHGSSALAPNFE